ncbi:MAG: hypothetical protein ACRDKZ_07405 [Actinomycetota bacterium]
MALGASDCERIGDGFLAQPVNALSSLAFVAAGLWILSWGNRRVPTAFGWVVLATGVGSFLFHGPQPAFARPAHDGTAIVAGVGAALLAGSELRRLGVRGFWGRHSASLLLTAAALAAYAGGRTASPLCDPDSPLQLHGAWHALLAAALAGFAVRASSET